MRSVDVSIACVSAMACILCLLACADTDSFAGREPTVSGTTPGSIANALANDSRFTVLTTLLDETGLLDTLDDPNQEFTVFAPVDAAFLALPDDIIAASNFVATGDRSLLSIGIDEASLTQILRGHVVDGSLSSPAVLAAESLVTLEDESTIFVNSINPTPEDRPGDEGDTFAVLSGRAQLLQTDLPANNGVFHVVDAVLIPSSRSFPGNLFELIEATPLFRPFFELLRSGGLNALITEFNTDTELNTVFVPAFGLEDVVASGEINEANADTARGHVFPGTTLGETLADADGLDIENGDTLARYLVDASGPSIEGTDIVYTDLRASNGVVHLALGPVARPDDTVADIITTTGVFASLRDALAAIEPNGDVFDPTTSAGSLLDELRTDVVTTVFAPDDQAFAVFAGIDEDLNADEPSDLAVTDNVAELIELGELDELLRYHVSAGAVDLASASTAVTDSGTISIRRFSIGATTLTTLNGVIEVTSSTTTANGSVVHAVGNVLVPAGLALPVLNETFPGSNQEAIEYFTVFAGFAGFTDVAYPIGLTADDQAVTFSGTLGDVLAGVPDAEFSGLPQTMTVFIPVSSAIPTSVADFIFDVDNSEFTADDIGPLHVVDGALPAAAIIDDASIPTFVLIRDSEAAASPGLFDISIDLDTLSVDAGGSSALLLETDLTTTNGVIHVIDNTLSPPASPPN